VSGIVPDPPDVAVVPGRLIHDRGRRDVRPKEEDVTHRYDNGGRSGPANNVDDVAARANDDDNDVGSTSLSSRRDQRRAAIDRLCLVPPTTRTMARDGARWRERMMTTTTSAARRCRPTGPAQGRHRSALPAPGIGGSGSVMPSSSPDSSTNDATTVGGGGSADGVGAIALRRGVAGGDADNDPTH
jgi:hypothetical protein